MLHSLISDWMGHGFLGKELHLPIRILPFAGGVPDLKSAGLPSNPSGVLRVKALSIL